MNKLTPTLVLAALLLACVPSSAADLGQARVRSQRGEALVVDVPLVFEGKDEANTLSIVATGSDAAAGGTGHIALAHELRRLDNGRHVVRLTSTKPVNAAKLTLWVMAEGAHGKASRNFQLTLRAASSAGKAEPPVAPSNATAVRPSARLSAGSLAAMNASLDEEAQRIRAVVARQRETVAAQVSQIEKQREQLARIGGQSQAAAEVTSAAQTQLNQRSESLRGLQDDLNAVIGTADVRTPAAIEEAPQAPSQHDSPAVEKANDAIAAIPARTRAAPTRVSTAGSPGAPDDPFLWWGMTGLTAGLAGTVYIQRRKRLAATAAPHEGVSAEARKPSRPAALEHLHMDRAFTDTASCAMPFKNGQRTWAESSGLTENLIRSMRKVS